MEAACTAADVGFSMGCGDDELLAEIGDGSDILGKPEDEGPEVVEVVVVGCLPEFAGAAPSLADEERVDKAEKSSVWFTF